METYRLQRPYVPGDAQRVLPQEEMGERLEAVHRVPRTDPDHPFIGLDGDQRRGE